jgi:hypothetical protein
MKKKKVIYVNARNVDGTQKKEKILPSAEGVEN